MYLLNLISHFRSMHDATVNVGAQMKIDFESFRVEISRGEQYFELVPTFASYSFEERMLKHSSAITTQTDSFAGWSLGESSSLAMRDNKLAFKQFCERHRLPTPALVSQPQVARAALVKEVAPRQRGTIIGPMPADRAITEASRLPGTYVEEFIDGDPIRAWYFGGQLACVERRRKPTIAGDGQCTVRELLDRATAALFARDESTTPYLLQAQDVTMDSIPGHGQVITVDLRYLSRYVPGVNVNENVLKDSSGAEFVETLKHAGKAFASETPEAQRNRSTAVVDAVVDAAGCAWLVGVGAEQYIHPDVYFTMIPALFGVAAGTESRPSIAVPALG